MHLVAYDSGINKTLLLNSIQVIEFHEWNLLPGPVVVSDLQYKRYFSLTCFWGDKLYWYVGQPVHDRRYESSTPSCNVTSRVFYLDSFESPTPSHSNPSSPRQNDHKINVSFSSSPYLKDIYHTIFTLGRASISGRLYFYCVWGEKGYYT